MNAFIDLGLAGGDATLSIGEEVHDVVAWALVRRQLGDCGPVGLACVSPQEAGTVVQGVGIALAPFTGGESLILVPIGGLLSAAGDLQDGNMCRAGLGVGLLVLGGIFSYSVSQVSKLAGGAVDAYGAVLEWAGAPAACR